MILQRYMGIVMLFRVLAVAAIVAAVGGIAAEARTIKQVGGPAELPPSGFKGTQFVDSRGCLFVRAGYGGEVSWVPRATRTRQVLCGYEPTFAANQTRPAQAQTEPNVLTLAAPAPKPAPAAPARAPMQTVATTTTAPRIHGTGFSSTVAAATYAAPRVASAPAPAPAPAAAPEATMAMVPSVRGRPVQLVANAVCPGLSNVTRIFTLDDGRSAVRCGGWGTSEYTIVRVAETPAPPLFAAGAPTSAPAPASGPDLMPLPQPTAAQQPAAGALPPIPKGYRAAWTDGRLNPYRGHGTAEGDAAMNLVWTRTVPRQLVDTRSGAKVNARFPWLSYPVTARPPQPTVKLASAPPQAATKVATAASRDPGRKWVRVANTRTSTARLSTSNAPAASGAASGAAAPAARHGGGRAYVQVGSFGVPANAARTRDRLQALGLPVQTGTLTSGGRTLQVVMAGPFVAQTQLAAALTAARRAGFRDAFIRR